MNRQTLRWSCPKVLHNFALDLRTHRQILMAVLSCDLSLEFGSEVWNTSKCQAKALESIQLQCMCL